MPVDLLDVAEYGLGELAEGTVYPALTRLEARGLLGSRLVPSSAGPARKYYAITPAGSDELARGSAAWESLAGTLHAALLRTEARSERWPSATGSGSNEPCCPTTGCWT